MPVVLVTGASGFIGSRTLAPLRRAGFTVHSFGRHAAEGATHHPGDLFDRAQTQAVLARLQPSHILHCAWEVSHGTFWHDPRNIDWVAATLDFARAAPVHGVTRFVGIGTCAEYDWSDGGAVPRKEQDTVAPRDLYGVAKDCTQRLLTALFAPSACTFAWARIFHLFGTGEHPARFVPSLVLALKEGREARCRYGQLTRDFIAVEDAGAAVAAIVAAETKGPINVASGASWMLAQLAHEIAGRIEGAHRLRIEETPTRDPLGMTADITRLREEVGFIPEHDPRERLARYVEAIGAL
jgi:nucleoside-diphosphate-sugar epimerase